ncbi:MAG: cation:proton antiporter [bacterium]
MPIQLNMLFVIILGGGWLFSRFFSMIKLPAVLGMVVFGIICSVTIKPYAHPAIWEISPFLKSFALIVILLRAGLGIKKKTLAKVGKPALMMSFIPCIIEGAALTVIIRYIAGFDWYVAGTAGFMLSAVSPAVIVPSMLDLKNKGHSKVPTIIIAGASVDDVLAITMFSVFLGLAGQNDINIFNAVLSVPLSIIGGIVSGVIVGGALSSFFRKKHQNIRATEKVMILLLAGSVLVQVGDTLHFAALLGIMTAGFILLEKNEPAAEELSLKLSKIWVVAEIILFVLIGFSLDINVAFEAGLIGVVIIFSGLLFRSAGVWLATFSSGLNYKERFFCIIAYLPKATVQAAIGSVPLSMGLAEGHTILAFAVIAIIITAPIGLFGIKYFSPKLLNYKISEN